MPGPRTDRTGGVGLVISGQGDGGDRSGVHVASGMHIRNDLAPGVRQRAPQLPGLLKEFQITGFVDGADRGEAMAFGGNHLVAVPRGGVMQDVGASRLLWAWHHPTPGDEVFRGVA